MIASSIYELDLKCLECVNLHTEFHKDPSWGRHYFNAQQIVDVNISFSRLVLLRILRG